VSVTFEELYKRVLLRLEKADGKALLAAKEGINSAQKVIVRVQDFDELVVTDTTNALTEASTATYALVDDWGLTRPKDILSLRYMDEGESIKLVYVPPRSMDEVLPYTLTLGERKPYWYTQRGTSVELIPVPDEEKSVYVMYTQWPTPMTDDSAEMDLPDDVDDVMVALGTDIAQSILVNEVKDWVARARALLSGSAREEGSRPDRMLIAQPFRVGSKAYGEYWKQPFVKHNP